MSITKSFINKFLSLMLVLSVVLAGLLPSTAVYASEVNTPGSAKSNAVLNSDGLIMDVTVPTNVLIYVDEHGEVTTPDYLPIINNSVAPVFVHSLSVTTENGWTLDPTNTDYTNFKVNQKNYWLSFNGLDPSNGPIALATPINGSDSLNLVLSAGVAPQRTAINGLNIGEITIVLDWDMNEDAQDPIDPEIPGDEGDLEKFGFSIEGAINTAPKTYTFNLAVTEPGQYFVAITYPGTPAPKFPHEALAQEFLNITEVGTSEQTVSFSAVSESMTDADIYVWTQDSNWLFVGPVKAEVRASGSGGYADYDNPDFNLDDYPDGYVMAKNSDWRLGAFANDPVYIGKDDYVIIPESVQGTEITGLNGTFKHEYYSHPVKGVYVDNTNITQANRMFQDSIATTLDLQYINIPNITSAKDMFNNTKAETLNLTGWDVSKLHSAQRMFKDSEATEIVLSGLNFESLNNSIEMFAGVNVGTLTLKGQTFAANEMFKGATIDVLDLSEFKFQFPDGSIHTMDSIFKDVFKDATIGTLYVFDRDQAELINRSSNKPAGLKAVIKGQPELPEGYVLALDRDFSETNKFTYRKPEFLNDYYGLGKNVTGFEHDKFVLPSTIRGVEVTSYSGMMSGFQAGDENKLPTHFKSSNPAITDMAYMFKGYPTATLNLDFNTSNVTTMAGMFSGTKATNLDLSGFNTDKVENMSSMFNGAEASVIDISSFRLADTQPDVSDMFKDAEATTVYVRSQADIDYIIANHGFDLPANINFVIK